MIYDKFPDFSLPLPSSLTHLRLFRFFLSVTLCICSKPDFSPSPVSSLYTICSFTWSVFLFSLFLTVIWKWFWGHDRITLTQGLNSYNFHLLYDIYPIVNINYGESIWQFGTIPNDFVFDSINHLQYFESESLVSSLGSRKVADSEHWFLKRVKQFLDVFG